LQSEDIIIKGLQIDFGYKLSGLTSIPDQLALPIMFVKSNIFGQKKTDNISPNSFATTEQYNIRKIFIPLSLKTKGLSISLPFAFNTGKTSFIFTISHY
jgi:hypothetical protein